MPGSALRRFLRLAAGVAAICCFAPPTPATAAGAIASPARLRLALSSLGDLSPCRRIASDTLALVDRGDVPAARARIKDIKTAWDEAEATSKPKDEAIWTTLDTTIDSALTDLRTPDPTPATCAASLRALTAKLDAVDKA